jgi:hypothetical protein
MGSAKWPLDNGENRKVHAMTFLDEIENFLHQTGIQKSKFGKAITGNPNFVQRVIQGSKTKPSTVAKARAFMAEHRGVKIEPRISNEEHLRRSLLLNQHVVRPHSITVVDRDPCGFCGIRRDLGCKHYPKSEPVRIA